MIEWIKKYNVVMKAVAILTAIILWFVVIQAENPERSVDFYGIPIEFIGQQELLEKHGLVMIGNTSQEVNLELSGSIAALTGVSQEDITIRADISKFTSAGEYKVSYDISAIDQVVVKSRNPNRINIVLDDVIEKELVILEPKIDGKLGDDIRIGEVTTAPKTVTISGAKSELENAAAAQVSVNSSRLSDTYSGALDYTIVDADGKEVVGNTITKIDKKINMEIPVQKVKTVPLEIEITNGAGANAEDAIVKIEPQSIDIIGSVKDIDKVERIVLGEISLDDFILSADGKFDIALPEGIEAVNGESEAEYHISFKDIDTMQLNVDNIEIKNPPENMDVEVQSISIVVTVRGHKDELKSLTTDDIKLVADLAGKKLINGHQIVSAEAVLDESVEDAAVLGTYSIIIETSEREDTFNDSGIGINAR